MSKAEAASVFCLRATVPGPETETEAAATEPQHETARS